jgi:hypothetical protein
MDLIDLIHYENEKTGLDFKAVIYKADKFVDLLKDIMAMANAALEEDRYIVVGIKHHPSSERVILGVEEFMDDATYFQLVHSNIEPDIHFEYFHVEVADKKVGVFRIFNCDNQPYLMKKDTKNLRRGDGFIRKGTSQMRLMRSDLDKIFARRQSADEFTGKIDTVFESDGKPCTTLQPWAELVPPSEEAAIRIRAIIADKEAIEAARAARISAQQSSYPGLSKSILDSFAFSSNLAKGLQLGPGMSLKYEDRDVSTLKANLAKVRETYEERDLHYLYEQKAHKINILITNTADRYIEDCSVEIRIKRSFDFVVATTVYEKYQGSSGGYLSMPIARPASYARLHYPKVKADAEWYTVSGHPGDLKHQLSTAALGVPIRVLLPPDSAGNKLELVLTIFGKNLPKPYVKTLLIDIV